MTQLNYSFLVVTVTSLFMCQAVTERCAAQIAPDWQNGLIAEAQKQKDQVWPPEAQNLVEARRQAFAEVKRWFLVGFGILMGMFVLIGIILLYVPRDTPKSRPFDPLRDRKSASRPSNGSSDPLGPPNKGWKE